MCYNSSITLTNENIMINTKYDYKQLKRKNVNGKRHYIIDGVEMQPVPSVTTVLSATTPKEDTEGLNKWRRKVGYAKANAICSESANRGTRVHNYLEKYILTGTFPTPGSNPYAKHANNMAKVVKDQGLKNMTEYWGTEVPLLFPKLYGGTTDLCGVHGGEEAIVDFKQSNKVKKREWIDGYFIQTVMYGKAHDEMYGTKIKKGVIMMITPDLEYQEFVLEGKEYERIEQVMWKRLEQYYELWIR